MSDQTSITEIDAALLSAIKSLIEILVSNQIETEEKIAHLFESQREAFLQNNMPSSAGIMEHLRLYTLNPTRQVERQELLKLLKTPPAGMA